MGTNAAEKLAEAIGNLALLAADPRRRSGIDMNAQDPLWLADWIKARQALVTRLKVSTVLTRYPPSETRSPSKRRRRPTR
jgi:hypothetical protein